MEAETTFTVNKLTHQGLVNLFSTATYGNDSAIMIEPAQESEDLQLEAQSREDFWASILEQGGSLWVYDLYDESTSKEEAEYYGKQGINWVETDYRRVTNKVVDIYGRVHIISKFSVPAYKITMETLLAGINANTKESSILVQELFIDEDYDLYTAYNLMQVAVFGEIIYG